MFFYFSETWKQTLSHAFDRDEMGILISKKIKIIKCICYK